MENSEFREIHSEQITINPFTLIGEGWMLITAGTLSAYNTMTASWGGFGYLWEKNVCFCVIRPQRYTREFVEKSAYFTLSYFAEKYRNVLEFCGYHSGRKVNKAIATGLTPVENPSGVVYFNEAHLVIVGKKIYFQDLQPQNFLDAGIARFYPKQDYHRMFIGEVIKCLTK